MAVVYDLCGRLYGVYRVGGRVERGGGGLDPGRYHPDSCEVFDMGGGVIGGLSFASRNALANGLCFILRAVTSSF